MMEAKAIAKNISMSPRKVRLVVDQIRGRSVNEAYAILQFSKKAAADPVSKTLRSAVANAQYRAKKMEMSWTWTPFTSERSSWTRGRRCGAGVPGPWDGPPRSASVPATSP